MSLKINKNDDLLEAPIYFIELTFKFDIMNINGQCRQFKTRKALKILENKMMSLKLTRTVSFNVTVKVP